MKLEDLEKKNIYQVPQNYFDKLPGRVMMQVQENNPAEQVSIWVSRRYFYCRSALVGLVLILTFVCIFLLNSQPSLKETSTSLLARISDKEALDYLVSTEKLETRDLTLLSQANTDLAHEFIQVSREDVLRELEELELEELELN